MRATSRLVLAALAVGALLMAAPATAQGMSTKGMRHKGYTFSTDVSSLWRLDIDFCQIFQMLFGPPSDVPSDIFYNGSAATAPMSLAVSEPGCHMVVQPDAAVTARAHG